jgi:hypothetical protein
MIWNPGMIVIAHAAVIEDPEAAMELNRNAGSLPDGNPVHVVYMLPARAVISIPWIQEEDLVGFELSKSDRITVLRTAAEVRAEIDRRKQKRGV